MLSTKKARKLVRDVQFPGDTDNTYRIAVGGKRTRRVLINDVDCRDRKTAGALEIQRVWRGFRTRKKYATIIEKRRRTEEKAKRRRVPLLERRYGDYEKWCEEQLGVGQGSGVVMEFTDYCARVIQVWWRTLKMGLQGERKSNEPQRKHKSLSEDEAAQIIQRAWKRYRNKKMFSFYRNLVDFRQKGDPAVLLKTINPSEAKLLDKALGGCVRFRLGGSQFPPSIYYKIFTSQAVVDVCSYSPRDYTAMTSQRQLERDRHSHGGRAVKDDDGSNWYKRWENNGWRLVSERCFQSRLQDSVTIETSAKRQPFHHSSLQRRTEVERMRKRKKMEWLKKLYHPQSQVQAEERSEAAEVEDEVDELLDWTKSLNYEEYVSEWSQIATSAALPASCDHHLTT